MKRKRWARRLIGGVLGLAALGGCRQQLYLEPQDYQAAVNNVELRKLETEPYIGTTPLATPSGGTPATVLDPSRTPRPLTLKEAIAIALEQGTIGSGFLPGLSTETSRRFSDLSLPSGGSPGSRLRSDSIKAFALDTAFTGAEIERSVSKFDARWINSITWNKNDQPTLTLQQSFSNGDSATLSSTLAKPLPTGGVAGITFSTNYLNLANPPDNTQFVSLATSYTPRLQFIFEQPLLQGFGVEINQLLTGHPGSALIPGLRPSGGQGSEGILLTRLRHDQQRAQFDVVVNQMLLSVEGSYWELYAAYYNLAAQEEGFKQALNGLFIIRNRVVGGLIRPAQLAQAQAQVELFRAQVVTARGQVLTADRDLRTLLGLKSDDGTRLIPVDEPTLVPIRADWHELYAEALQARPELSIARQELKAQQLNLVLQRNLRRPDLRFFSSYDIAGLGRRLDGRNSTDDPNRNALENFTANDFNSWQLGLRLDMPLGFRDGNALVRQAQLTLYRTFWQLTYAEQKTQDSLTDQYRRVVEAHELIRYRRAQRVYLEEQVRLEEEFRVIGERERSYENYILTVNQAQRDLADATAREFQAIADYNVALAALEFAKGTIQRYNNVSVADGPLPQHVEKKAADHFRAREAALKLREHPADMPLIPLHQWQPSADLGAGPLPPPPGTPVPPMPWQASQPGAPTPVPLQSETSPAPKDKTPGGTPISTPIIGGAVPAPMSESPFRATGTLTLPPSPRRTLPADTTPLPSPPTVESPGGVPTVALPPVPPP